MLHLKAVWKESHFKNKFVLPPREMWLVMDLDDSGFLTLRELARGVPTITQVSSYLISRLHSNNWKISLSHFEVTDPDGICCQPGIFTGCQIGPAPNCPFSYLGAKMFVCFLGAKLSTFTILVPYCPGAKLSFNLSLSLYSVSCDIYLQPRSS